MVYMKKCIYFLNSYKWKNFLSSLLVIQGKDMVNCFRYLDIYWLCLLMTWMFHAKQMLCQLFLRKISIVFFFIFPTSEHYICLKIKYSLISTKQYVNILLLFWWLSGYHNLGGCLFNKNISIGFLLWLFPLRQHASVFLSEVEVLMDPTHSIIPATSTTLEYPLQ